MTDTMKDLIERLESATEGSRELDAEIAVALRWLPRQMSADVWTGPWVRDGTGFRVCKRSLPQGAYCSAPRWTTSIDAKLPDENITDMKLTLSGKYRCWHSRNGQQFVGYHKIEAIARRIAALKASTEAGT